MTRRGMLAGGRRAWRLLSIVRLPTNRRASAKQPGNQGKPASKKIDWRTPSLFFWKKWDRKSSVRRKWNAVLVSQEEGTLACGTILVLVLVLVWDVCDGPEDGAHTMYSTRRVIEKRKPNKRHKERKPKAKLYHGGHYTFDDQILHNSITAVVFSIHRIFDQQYQQHFIL